MKAALARKKRLEQEKIEAQHQEDLRKQEEELKNSKLPVSVKNTLRKALEGRKKKKEEELREHEHKELDSKLQELKPIAEKLPVNIAFRFLFVWLPSQAPSLVSLC